MTRDTVKHQAGSTSHMKQTLVDTKYRVGYAGAQDLAAHAFERGMAARGLAAAGPSGKYVLTGVIKTLQSNRYVRIDAEADITLRLVDGRGVQIFEKNYHAEQENGSIVALDTGVFADPDELRAAAVQALSKVVNQALDDPDFLRAISN